LDYIDVVGSHPLEALVQAPQQVLLGPHMGSVVGALVAAHYRTAALGGQYELIVAVRQRAADVLLKSYTLFERLSYWIQLPLVRLFGPVGFIGTGIRAL
jgi:hypothetical protein